MAMAAGAKRGKRIRLDEDGEEEIVDRISRLPDGVLGDIVSFLPTKDGARTQILSSRWRPIWRLAPLNFDLDDGTWMSICADDISRILSAHQGPGRRFCAQLVYLDPGDRSAALDGWLRSPALDNLQELKFHLGIFHQEGPLPPPLPASVHRFSSTLRAANFGGCTFPEGNGASPLHLPLLKQLSLWSVRISETSLHALLAACPALQSLLLTNIMGCSRVHIVSQSLRSIGLLRIECEYTDLQQLIIKDAPYLERLLCFETGFAKEVTVSVVSAPKLHVLALTCAYDMIIHNAGSTTFQFGSTVFQTQDAGRGNTWYRKYKNLIGTLEIRLKKIVLTNYRGNTPQVNFAKFFVLNARMLQSMRFELFDQKPSSTWIERQHELLQIKNKASRDIQFDFVAKKIGYVPVSPVFEEQVHDLSTADPFIKLHNWL